MSRSGDVWGDSGMESFFSTRGKHRPVVFEREAAVA